MRKIVFALLIFALSFVSCNTAKKELQKGHFHNAVVLSVKKLQKNKNKTKYIEILKEAYDKANQKDNDRIKFLNTEGRSDRWEEIYQLYEDMRTRQELVKSVTPLELNGKTVDFKFVDYDKKLVEAKEKAADYFYEHGRKMFEQNDRIAYRQAYRDFVKVKEYTTKYEDIDRLIQDSKALGTSFMLIAAKNETRFKLPKEFLQDIINFETDPLNGEWTIYHTRKIKDLVYDYTVLIRLKSIEVSADNFHEKQYNVKKKVRDGWKYVLDENGNVKKDSLGNDIKVPKYKTLFCSVTESWQTKDAHISGTIDYINNQTKQVDRSVPVAADHHFEHGYAVANGEISILSDETKELLNYKPVPFPNDMQMIEASKQTFKNVIRQALIDNTKYFDY